MAGWITLNASLELQKWLPEQSKDQDLRSPKHLAHELRNSYLHLRAEQERLLHLNKVLIRKGRHPIKVPDYCWTDAHAISLTAKMLPLLLGVMEVKILTHGGDLVVECEGSLEWLRIQVYAWASENAHLIVSQPPQFGHRLPLVGALSQLLHRPLRPEIQRALGLLKKLWRVYPPGSLVRDSQMRQFFVPSQLEALVKLQVLAKFGRDYLLSAGLPQGRDPRMLHFARLDGGIKDAMISGINPALHLTPEAGQGCGENQSPFFSGRS